MMKPKSAEDTIDEQFDRIVKDALEQADRVECNVFQYEAGLRHIVEQIQEVINNLNAEEPIDEVK